MTFNEWAESHDLMDHERRLCKEYLTFLRRAAAMAHLLEVIQGEAAEAAGEK